MPIKTYDSTNHNGLFDILGHCFYSISLINTSVANGGSIETSVLNILDAASLRTELAFQGMAAQIPSNLTGWQKTNSLTSTIASTCQTILEAFITNDGGTPSGLQSDLQYLINDMAAHTSTGGDYVTASAVTYSVGTVGSMGDCFLAAAVRNQDGYLCQNALAEVITITATAVSLSGLPSLTATSKPAISDMLEWDWGTSGYGSGIATTIPVISSGASLIANGNFNVTTNDPNQPDYWVIAAGLTKITLTAPQQQTITIAGSPTSGSYALKWSDNQGIVRITTPLNWDAQASDIQSALQAIIGLGSVTVSQTAGTSPNATFTVTMTGTPGNPAQFLVVNMLNTGTITTAISVAGNIYSYDGSTIAFQGDGSTIHELYYQLPLLSASNVYFLTFRTVAVNPGASTGVNMTFELLTGIGGAAVQDLATAQGLGGGAGNNWSSISLPSLTNGVANVNYIAVRVPASYKQPVYLHIKFQTAMNASTIMYLDNMFLAAGVELYSGGPWVAAVQGNTFPTLNSAWTVTVTNNRGGGGNLQNWFNRVFGMANYKLLLPMAGSVGAIPDSLIA